jgi:hypothetical protein
VPAENDPVSGFSIAHDFIDPLTTKFVEALPIVIGFLCLVTAVVMLISFAMSRGRNGGGWNGGDHDDDDGWWNEERYEWKGDD